MRCIMSCFNKMLYLSASFIVLNAASDVLANSDIESLNPTLTSHSLELRPHNSFQLARATFLPDTKDDLGFSGRNTGGGDYGQGDVCKDYTLSQCPANGTCTPCPTNPNKKKLTGCDSGYKISGNTCVAATCSAIDSSYKSFIPSNSYCTKVSKNGLTCYKDCKNISCSGYNLSCPSGMLSNTYVSNGITYQACPDCPILRTLNLTTVYNCTSKCKISQCPDKQKLNDAGTACVAKDDNCPNGYYKSCETGIETTVTPKYTEAGTACYQCKAKTPACKVPHCKKCSSPTSNYCTTCEDGYELSSDRKTCREISQCELNGYYNEERAAYYYGEDYECKLTPKLDDGTVCFSDCYEPKTCCSRTDSLSGIYNINKKKFETCGPAYEAGVSCIKGCITTPCTNISSYNQRQIDVGSCDRLSIEKLQLNSYWGNSPYDFFLTFPSSLNCPSTDVDFSTAFWTGLFPPMTATNSSNSWSTPAPIANVTVKSYTSPTYGGTISNVNLTASDKIVLHSMFLGNATITAPEVHIKGNLGMSNSKIIADDLYITSGVSIAVGGQVGSVTRYTYDDHTSSIQCRSHKYPGNDSFIGSPERPTAFHIEGEKDPSKINYGTLGLNGYYLGNLTIYGYNAETIPIFSEAVIYNSSYYNAGDPNNPKTNTLTISDIEGKSQSNLFYRFHTTDPKISSNYYNFIKGLLVYEGSVNGKSKQLCEEMKQNAYLFESSCKLQSAAHLVECGDIDYSRATCEMFGYSSNIPNDQECKEVTLSNGKTCYSDCKLTYCHYDLADAYNNVIFYTCSNSLIETYPGSLYCSEAEAGESPDAVCKKLQDNWRADENASAGYPDTITPIGTLPYFYNIEAVREGSVYIWSTPIENTTNKKCVICELVLRDMDGSVYE